MSIAERNLRKYSDPYSGLLAYPGTPLHFGYSPAELFFDQKLKFCILYLDVVKNKFSILKVCQFRNCNESHHTKMLSAFQTRENLLRFAGTKILRNSNGHWVIDQKSCAVIGFKEGRDINEGGSVYCGRSIGLNFYVY